jgi:hypothetical protein
MTRVPVIVAAIVASGVALTPPVFAQEEGRFQAEFRRERERIAESCHELKGLFGCVQRLVTDHPFHIALGSLAPGNGFGLGGAFVMNDALDEDWRIGYSADVVGTPKGAWRAGAYLKAVRTAVEAPVPVAGGGGGGGGIRPYPVGNLYFQSISLPSVGYYGLGPNAPRESLSFFGLREHILGANVVKPITEIGAFRRLNLAVLGEVNGRFVDIVEPDTDEGPSVSALFTDAGAPGLGAQPGFVQFGEGIRVRPSLIRDRLRLNYLAQFQQYVAPSDASSSFRRWTVDLGHEVPIYRNSRRPIALDTNGPNECATGPTADSCPAISRNRTGTVGFRLMISRSGVSNDSVVPFYFQQTLGGDDINGTKTLPSYDDYRFRGPHVILLQETLEHSIWGPIGLWLAADQGKVALQQQTLDFKDLRRSYAAGITLRAGGAPAALLSFATGGPEGNHVAVTVTTTLLGGSARPSLH